MFDLKADNAVYRRTGLALLSLQILLSVFGTPPFHTGIWIQIAPTMLAVFLLAAANCLWLATGVYKGWLVWRRPHPIFICLAAWVAWQCIATAFATSPWRSWFGPPEIGEGTAWYLALLILFLLAYPIWRIETYRPLLIGIASANLVALCALHWFFPENSQLWNPNRWADYLAFMAGYLWIFAATARQTPGWHCLLILLVYVTLYISSNMSAIVLLGGAMTFSVLAAGLRGRRLRRFLYPNRRWRIAAALLSLTCLAWVPASSYIHAFALKRNAANGLEATFLVKDNSMGSRVALNQVALAALRHEPGRWLMGDGWGRFGDEMHNYALIEGAHIFHDGQQEPSWSFILGTTFHSHNEALEVILSLGLPGLLLWLALPVVIVWTLPRYLFWRTAPMLTGLTMLWCLWFQLPQVLAYQALCLAALAGTRRTEARPANRPFFLFASFLLTVVMLLTAAGQRAAIRYENRLERTFSAIQTLNKEKEAHGSTAHECPGDAAEWLNADIARGGDRLRVTAVHYALWMIGPTKRGSAGACEYGFLRNLLQAAKEMEGAPGIGGRAAGLYLSLQYEILLSFGEPPDDLKAQVLGDMPASVLRMTELAPLRDDTATFFLYNMHDMFPDPSVRLEMLERILAIAPDHRGALWIKGRLLQGIPGLEEEGKRLMRRAVALGVDRIYPVTEEEAENWR